MRKRKLPTDRVDEQKNFLESSSIFHNPEEAANEIDAILYFIHKRYKQENSHGEIPALYSLLIHRADVVFTDEVPHVIIEKKPALGVLQILTPRIAKDREEERRIYLLSQFGDLIVKCQKQAYQQIREMLIGILDSDGREQLVNEFLKFKSKGDKNA